jgi:hypothetical protein
MFLLSFAGSIRISGTMPVGRDMWWARWSLWTIGSAVLTSLVVGNAFFQKKQFYPTVVYITKSKPSMAVITFSLWRRCSTTFKKHDHRLTAGKMPNTVGNPTSLSKMASKSQGKLYNIVKNGMQNTKYISIWPETILSVLPGREGWDFSVNPPSSMEMRNKGKPKPLQEWVPEPYWLHFNSL